MLSPMCQYQAESDGSVTDWHLIHYASRAVGGVGLVMVEASAVEARGRITTKDVGLYSDAHIPGLKRIVELCRAYGAKTAIQIAHAGMKAETEEPAVAPSAYTTFPDRYKTPIELSRDEVREMAGKFAAAAKRAVEAGFDTVEIHGAHGYLINEFLSPLTNKRTDEYGGSFENRLRFPLDVIRAVKEVLPEGMPLLMRVSATEYAEDGYDEQEMVEMVKCFKEAGVDMVDCSSGGSLPIAPKMFPGYQLHLSETLRKGAELPTIAVGMLDAPALAEQAVQLGRADLVAIGRGLLRDPYWAKRAAVELKAEMELPGVYKMAF